MSGTIRKEIEIKLKHEKAVTNGLQKIDSNLKNVDSSINHISTSAKSYITQMGAMVIKTLALTRTLRAVYDIGVNFSKIMGQVKAVSGASAFEFAKLEKTARHLGETTMFTATQVGELQLMYSKLGFTTQQILDAQEATLALAAATGGSLKNAADLAGSVIRSFGLDAKDLIIVVDQLATSFTNSALDIENYTEAIKYIAPLASAFGFQVKDITALLMSLANAGIRGSIAGTGLKNLISKMTDDSSKLAIALGGPIRSFDELVTKFSELNKSTPKFERALKGVDLRVKSVFVSLVHNSGALENYQWLLEHSAGSAKKMSDIMMATAWGSVKKFTSALQELALTYFDVAQGNNLFSSSLDNLTGFIRNNKEKIVEWTGPLLLSAALTNKVSSSLVGLISDYKGLTEAENGLIKIQKKMHTQTLVVSDIVRNTTETKNFFAGIEELTKKSEKLGKTKLTAVQQSDIKKYQDLNKALKEQEAVVARLRNNVGSLGSVFKRARSAAVSFAANLGVMLATAAALSVIFWGIQKVILAWTREQRRLNKYLTETKNLQERLNQLRKDAAKTNLSLVIDKTPYIKQLAEEANLYYDQKKSYQENIDIGKEYYDSVIKYHRKLQDGYSAVATKQDYRIQKLKEEKQQLQDMIHSYVPDPVGVEAHKEKIKQLEQEIGKNSVLVKQAEVAIDLQEQQRATLEKYITTLIQLDSVERSEQAAQEEENKKNLVKFYEQLLTRQQLLRINLDREYDAYKTAGADRVMLEQWYENQLLLLHMDAEDERLALIRNKRSEELDIIKNGLDETKTMLDEMQQWMTDYQAGQTYLADFYADDEKKFQIWLNNKYNWLKEHHASTDELNQWYADAVEKHNKDIEQSDKDVLMGHIQMGAQLGSALANMGQAFSKDKKEQKRLALAGAYIDSAAAFVKALASGPPPWNLVEAGIVAASAAAQIHMIEMQKFALGGSFITNGPAMIDGNKMVGDNPGGRELVTVTPLSSPNVNGPTGKSIHIHFNAPVSDKAYVEDVVIPAIVKAQRRGQF